MYTYTCIYIYIEREIYTYIYIYRERERCICTHTHTLRAPPASSRWKGDIIKLTRLMRVVRAFRLGRRAAPHPTFGRGDDTVGNPRRAQIRQFELFQLILLLKLDKQFPVEQFEATVSQSTVPYPPLTPTSHGKNSLSKICSKGWVAQKSVFHR